MSLKSQKAVTYTYLFNLYINTSGCHHGSQGIWLNVDRMTQKLARNFILVQRPVCSLLIQAPNFLELPYIHYAGAYLIFIQVVSLAPG